MKSRVPHMVGVAYLTAVLIAIAHANPRLLDWEDDPFTYGVFHQPRPLSAAPVPSSPVTTACPPSGNDVVAEVAARLVSEKSQGGDDLDRMEPQAVVGDLRGAVAAGRGGLLVGLDRGGRVAWTFRIAKAEDGFAGKPLLHDCVVYAGGANGVVYAIERTSGHLIWGIKLGVRVHSIGLELPGRLRVRAIAENGVPRSSQYHFDAYDAELDMGTGALLRTSGWLGAVVAEGLTDSSERPGGFSVEAGIGSALEGCGVASICVIDVATRKELSRLNLPWPLEQAPVVVGRQVFLVFARAGGLQHYRLDP